MPDDAPDSASLLAGIRVLDLTNVLSGPFATLHLALLGAEVIKIENPADGDLARKLGCVPEYNQMLMGTSFLAQNANKKSLTLNLKAPEGKEIFRKLVATADVVVENFRPDVMKRLGLSLRSRSPRVNPRLIYCAISGFGQTGPDALKPAYDQIIQGLSGEMAINGDERLTPLRAGFPVCDTVGGLNAAFADHGGALSPGTDGGRTVHRRRAPRFDHAADGMGGRQPHDRRTATGADGERQLHRGAFRRVQDEGRVHQHRGEQAGTVGSGRRRPRPPGAENRSAFQGTGHPEEKPEGADAAPGGEACWRETRRTGWRC